MSVPILSPHKDSTPVDISHSINGDIENVTIRLPDISGLDASIQITLDTYSHVAPGIQEAAAARFDANLISGKHSEDRDLKLIIKDNCTKEKAQN